MAKVRVMRKMKREIMNPAVNNYWAAVASHSCTEYLYATGITKI
jgi:hypothetical protein